MKNADTDTGLTPTEARDILESDEVNEYGEEARLRARKASGNRIYYGEVSAPDEVVSNGYNEVRLSEAGKVEAEHVDAFIGEPGDSIDDHRRVLSLGVPTDVAVKYGDGALVERLADVRELASEEDVRCITLYPADAEPVTTAYTDLKAVAVTRLFLSTEDVPLLRVARSEVGDKLAQTALVYGANDLGFVAREREGDEDGNDPALIGREAGFKPVRRSEEFGDP